MLRIGVCGVGHFGTIHLRCLKDTPFVLSGVYDIDSTRCQEKAKEYDVVACNDYDELLAKVDAVIITTPSEDHYDYAHQAIAKNKSVFIEKPLTKDLEEARKLMHMPTEVVVQVGHNERFNAAIKAVAESVSEPKFIEGHRLAPYSGRGTEVSVVMDLMIHDLDLILHWIPYEIQEIKANGVALLSDQHDICNARIEFVNGAVVNLTASRLSMKQMRKLRIFQSSGYISIDLLDKKVQDIRIEKDTKGEVSFEFCPHDVQETNAIVEELREFHDCILHDLKPKVGLREGYKALQVADEIHRVLNASTTPI